MSVSFSDVWDHIKKKGLNLWDDISDFIIRPPRADYTLTALGPQVFRIQSGTSSDGKPCAQAFKRHDFTLENMRGMKIECSWYRPYVRDGQENAEPCVVFLHGNAGCRLDAQECLFLLEHGITLFSYDATGSGLSDGDYVSLGIYERQDLAAVVEHLRLSSLVTTIGLWGRSMGAVTAIMYGSRDASISCLILDSPFSTLKILIADLVEQHAQWAPNFAIDSIVEKVRRRIIRRANFDIDHLDTLAAAGKCDVPCFIFHGRDDTFVRPVHSEMVAEVYRGSCLRHEVEGGHNDERLSDARDVALSLLKLYLIEKPSFALQMETQKSASEAAKKSLQAEQEKQDQEVSDAKKQQQQHHHHHATAISLNPNKLKNNNNNNNGKDDDSGSDTENGNGDDDDDLRNNGKNNLSSSGRYDAAAALNAKTPRLSDVLIASPCSKEQEEEAEERKKKETEKHLDQILGSVGEDNHHNQGVASAFG